MNLFSNRPRRFSNCADVLSICCIAPKVFSGLGFGFPFFFFFLPNSEKAIVLLLLLLFSNYCLVLGHVNVCDCRIFFAFVCRNGRRQTCDYSLTKICTVNPVRKPGTEDSFALRLVTFTINRGNNSR